jgi:AcrR family transcriptional regulator
LNAHCTVRSNCTGWYKITVIVENKRSGKGALTRKRILDAAADLFHAQGINATSVGDVLRASATGKGQFYQHFESRDALVVAVFERYRAMLRAGVVRPIESWDGVREWMEMHLRAQKSAAFLRGCPLGTAAYALQSDQDDLRAELKQIFDDMRANLVNFFRQERREGRLADRAEPRSLAAFAVACVQGGMLLDLVDRGPRPARAAIDEAYAHLRSFVTDGPES